MTTEDFTATEMVVASFTESQLLDHDNTQRNAGFSDGHEQGYRIGIAHSNDAYRNIIKEVFVSEVSEGNLDRDYATGLFNAIAEKAGQPTIESIGGVYKATVSVFGNTLFEVEVEADDEDDARDKVTEDISFEDIELSFTARFNGERGDGTVAEYEWDFEELLRDNMEVEVEEA